MSNTKSVITIPSEVKSHGMAHLNEAIECINIAIRDLESKRKILKDSREVLNSLSVH